MHTDDEIRAHLKALGAGKEQAEAFGTIERVDDQLVVVRSAKTGRLHAISFEEIRDADHWIGIVPRLVHWLSVKDAEAPPTVWVDTNVMAEIYTQGDLHRDAARGPALVESRRILLQGSMWFAMALDEQAATTISFEGESRDTILKLAPPESDVAAWTSSVLYILRPYVFPNWKPQKTGVDAALPKGREGNNPRDALMVSLAKDEGLTLVTRDQTGKRGQPSAYELAKVHDVPVMTPEEYAVRVLSRETARDRFLERLERYLTAVSNVLDVHRAIWD